jgi:hypothetical protein
MLYEVLMLYSTQTSQTNPSVTRILRQIRPLPSLTGNEERLYGNKMKGNND